MSVTEKLEDIYTNVVKTLLSLSLLRRVLLSLTQSKNVV